MSRRKIAGALVIAAMAVPMPTAWAQDSGGAAPTEGPTYSLPPEGNPLEGLFTPQPQYPTPQSVHNPDPYVPPGNEDNPIKALFNVQPQYPTPQNPGYSTPEAPKSDNHLQGLFTGQPRFATPQTPANPQPQPKYYIPGYNTERGPWRPGQPTDGGAAERAELAKKKAAEAAPAKDAAKDSKDANAKDSKDAKDKTKTAAKDEKSKDGKDKETKDKGEKTASPMKDADKDKEKESTDSLSGEKSDKDADAADKDKEADTEEANGDSNKDAKDQDKDKEEKPVPAVYNPLQEAIFLMNSGQSQQALNTLSSILKTQPSNPEAHYLKGVAFVRARQYSAAAQEYQTVLRLVPTTALAQLAADGLRKIGGSYPDTPKLPPLEK